MPNASTALTDGVMATLLPTTPVIVGETVTNLTNGPGATLAVIATTETVPVRAVTVCMPDTVPNVHVPDVARPLASVLDESLSTFPELGVHVIQMLATAIPY